MLSTGKRDRLVVVQMRIRMVLNELHQLVGIVGTVQEDAEIREAFYKSIEALEPVDQELRKMLSTDERSKQP